MKGGILFSTRGFIAKIVKFITWIWEGLTKNGVGGSWLITLIKYILSSGGRVGVDVVVMVVLEAAAVFATQSAFSSSN